MTQTKTILAVFGTRPEAIKLCPVVAELKKRKNFTCRVCATGQHREMLRGIPELFGVESDDDLAIMKKEQDLFDLTVRVLEGMRDLLRQARPDLVLVHGDTTTAFGTALACFYCGIPVAHVEAGLRTYNMTAPFPEEWNRRAVSLLATHHFAPTLRAKKHLLLEGVAEERITVTGNTGIDALRWTVCPDYAHPDLDWAKDSRLLLLTAHRRENLGQPMRTIFRGIRQILREFPDVKLLYPVHLNPKVRALAEEELGGCDRIRLIPPMEVLDFHNVLARCFLILTDSGGIQEEAAGLNKPVLVLRNVTERPEGLESGSMRLVGTGEGSVYRGIRELLENDALYNVMSHAENPYGDGYASERIADALEKILYPSTVYDRKNA